MSEKERRYTKGEIGDLKVIDDFLPSPDDLVIHEVEEGGFWAEVPAIPGCATQGDTIEELMENLREAIEGCLSVDTKSKPR
ncbi:MAG: type II toxin-antitoxin system HicB family antitoxin [Methyloceanibacter sp.]